MTAGTRVLIVEDDPQMVRFLRATLTAHEFAVTVAEGVAAGATAAAADPPDVVLLDLGLPDGDGLELARDQRLNAPQAAATTIASATVLSAPKASPSASAAASRATPSTASTT